MNQELSIMPGSILLPTAYFPPVSYFVYILRHDNVVIEQMETYPKQTYRNRCEILTSGGRLNLIIPVSKTYGNHTPTLAVSLNYREDWTRHHWKSIQTAYHSSPYFQYYADIIQPLILKRESGLLQFNTGIVKMLFNVLGIDRQISFSKDFDRHPAYAADFRESFKPGRTLPNLAFQAYPQVFGHLHGFVPDLSILDLLFNLGPDAVNYLDKLVGRESPDQAS